MKFFSSQTWGIQIFGVCCLCLEISYTLKKAKLILVFLTMISHIAAGYGNELIAWTKNKKKK
jgi:hypothetical protein